MGAHPKAPSLLLVNGQWIPLNNWWTGVLKLCEAFAGDMGALWPLFLNMVRLQPGEPHCYLEGAGMELMANSDNVLRGGLTGKHRDLPELFSILRFDPAPPHLLEPEAVHPQERVYSTVDGDFLLSIISLDRGAIFESREDRAVELMICIQGEADMRHTGSEEILSLKRGDSVLIPTAVRRYRIGGEATLYKATVPKYHFHHYGHKPLVHHRHRGYGDTPFICREKPANERFEFLCVLGAFVVNAGMYFRNSVRRFSVMINDAV